MKRITRVRASGLQEISEVVAKGSRVKVIDSNAMARVEVVSLTSTNGRSWPWTLATNMRPKEQNPLLNVALGLNGIGKRFCPPRTLSGTNLEQMIDER